MKRWGEKEDGRNKEINKGRKPRKEGRNDGRKEGSNLEHLSPKAIQLPLEDGRKEMYGRKYKGGNVREGGRKDAPPRSKG